MGLFSGKIGLVMGVANDHSIAWAMSEALYAEGAELAFTHLPSPSSERRVRRLVESRAPQAWSCPATCRTTKTSPGCSRRSGPPTGGWTSSFTPSPSPRRRTSARPYLQTSRAGWHLAMDISVYSLVAACRAAAPLMTGGGAVVTISYFGGEKVIPGYNLMGVCKAALEHSVRYLAWDLGRQNIRVNAISAGPMRTLSSVGIADFDTLREHAAKKAPLGRNVDPQELGATGLYLLGDLSRGVTGETIHVDCGYNIVGL